MSSTSGHKTKDMNFENAKRMRKNPTHEEMYMWELLRDRRCLGLKFRRQHPINSYIADFYCHELNVVIELDGKYHEHPDQQVKDKKRTEDLNGINVTVYRITNEEFRDQAQTIEKFRQFLMALNGSLSSQERAGVRL